MKKILICILALITASVIGCYGAALDADTTSGVPTGWLYSADGGTITDTTRDGANAVSLQGSGDMALLNLTTSVMNFSTADKVYGATVFESYVTNGSGAYQSLSIAWGEVDETTGAVNNSLALAEIDEYGDITVCGVTKPLTDGKHILSFTATPITKGISVAVYLDGEMIAESEETFRKNYPDFSSLRFNWGVFYCPLTDSQYADLDVYSFNMTDSEKPVISSNPADGDSFATVPEKGITVDFGTVMHSAPESVTVEKSDDDISWEPVNAATEFTGKSLIILPETVSENASYKITLGSATALSGEVYEGGEFAFKTATGDYVPPQVMITFPADGAHFRSGDSVNISAEISTEAGIEKTEYFIDGELVGDGDGVLWKAPKQAGGYTIEVVSTDIFGGTGRHQITVIVDENKLPQVSFVGIRNNALVTELKELTISAEDADGSIKEVQLYANGELIEKREADGIFDISGMYGSITFKAVAVDNDGGRSEVSIFAINVASGNPYALDTKAENSTTITFKFNDYWRKNGTILSDVTEFVVFECETGEAEIESFKMTSGTTYTLKLKNPLDGGCTYNLKVKVNDKCVRTPVKTEYNEVDVTNAVFKPGEQSELEISVINNSEIERTVYAVLVMMDDQGRDKGCVTQEITVGGGKTKSVVLSGGDAAQAEAYIIKSEVKGKGVINRIFKFR